MEAQFIFSKTVRTGLVISVVLGVVIGFIVGSYLPYHPQMRVTDLERIGAPKKIMKAPTYSGFQNQNGKRVNSSDFRGKVQVVTFLFPYCGSLCPILATRMLNLEALLNANGLSAHVQLLSFNVDPANTGPKQMRAFMREFGADPQNPEWQYLTATPEKIHQVVLNGFHANYQKISLNAENRLFAQQRQSNTLNYMPNMVNKLANRMNPNFDVTHNSSAVIVGPHGYVRYIIGDANSVSAHTLYNHILRILQNQRGHGS